MDGRYARRTSNSSMEQSTSAASENAQHAGSTHPNNAINVGSSRAPQRNRSPSRLACIGSVGIARTSLMTQRAFRAKPGSSKTTPGQLAGGRGT
eukprot:6213024-Pleurochrysis_carterae.AAC.8